MSYVTFVLHDQAIHLSSIILIISGGRYNLWSYTLCSFLQLPITFRHNSLTTDQHCSQTQSAIYSHCHKPSVTPTAIKILCKPTHVYTSIASFLQAGSRTKCHKAAVRISPNSFPLNFIIIIQSLLPNATSKISNDVSARSWLYGLIFPSCLLVNTQLLCSNYKWQLHVSAIK